MSAVVDCAGTSSGDFQGQADNGTQWPSTLYAIRLWVMMGSGLPPASVIWYGQNTARPAGPWISLRMQDAERGWSWYDRVSNADGSVTQYTRARVRATLTITCYAGMPDPTNPNGQRGPVQILSDVLGASDLEATWNVLRQYKVGVADWDRVRSTDGVINSAKYEPRAMTTVVLHLTGELSEISGWINAVNATGGGDAAGITVHSQRS